MASSESESVPSPGSAASKLTLQSSVKLGTGYAMPLLGLGVYQNRGPSCTAACVAALEVGYRHIDSAVVYWNEAEVGEAIVKSGLKREDIFVTTKIVSRFHGYATAAQKVDESLKAFNFEYIDLYLIHDPLSGKERRIAAYKALLDAQKAGKIRSVGVSNYNVHHIEEIIAEGLALPSVNQIELHPYCQQRPIVEYCNKKGIIVQAYSPLAQGKIGNDLKAIAATKGVDVYKLLIRWSLQKGFVPLPKSERADKIAANADVYDFELSTEEMKAIAALDKGKAGAVTWNPVDAP